MARAYYLTVLERYARLMGEPFRRSNEHAHTCSRARALAKIARGKAIVWRQRYEHWVANRYRRLYEKWRCIHEHEGAWNANTGNGYYGGLQMTLWFQQHYGPEFFRRWGTADRWPVWAQLTAAERAYRQDGDYGQWGTASTCGLPT